MADQRKQSDQLLVKYLDNVNNHTFHDKLLVKYAENRFSCDKAHFKEPHQHFAFVFPFLVKSLYITPYRM